MKVETIKDKIVIETIEDKAYVHLKINDIEKDIELEDLTNFEQDNILWNVTTTITKAIINVIDFNEVYKGIQSLIDLYWNWQINPFKNEEISELNKYRYRYEFKINDVTYKIFFDWKEFEATASEINYKFYNKIYDLMMQTVTNKIIEELRDMHYTKLAAAITCECSPKAEDLWDNI